MKTTKITAGLYQVTYKGRVFQIEDIRRFGDEDTLPGWIAYEMNGDTRSYLNDYRTKRAAIATTIKAVEAGY